MAFIVARAHDANSPAARAWGCSMAAGALAFLCWFVGREVGHWMDFVLGNLAAVLFSVYFLKTFGLLTYRPFPRSWLALQFCIGAGGLAAVELMEAPRAFATVSIALSFLAAGIGGMVAIARHPPVRSSLWGKLLLTTLGIWNAAVIGGRIAMLVIGGSSEAVRPLATSGPQVLALLSGVLMLAIVSLGVLAILGDQQRGTALEQARRDGLTGALTRSAFFERMKAQLNFGPFSIAMVDLDHFKRYNDTYGHSGGDAVLSQASGLLLRHVRSNDLVGRYGGEEFCIFLPNCEEAEAQAVAQRLCSESAQHRATLPSGDSVPYTVSIGVATGWITQQVGALSVMERTIDMADKALYAAKSGGRNCVKTQWEARAVNATHPVPSFAASQR